ncbi:response regulator transcription factor [Geomonas sp. Red32]|uniref:response regulator n=1 Tax=Geomonas sp. Red32 TaxID=2912856 RepID=UPI00202CFD0C|nr:response regulator transcription factor [Geomonas sp. Red32]MCM0084190.1 response regulator transcription factor [Geomonas sp. Red32]
MPITLLLADDHAVVRDGLRMILDAQEDLKVVGMAADGRSAVREAMDLKPDVVVMDIAMPGLNGIEAASIISRQLPSTYVLILTMHHTSEHVHRALQAGARGYLLKESAGEELLTAVRAVGRGRRYYGSEVPVAREASPLESLSQREREVLQLVAEGKSSATIATTLSLSAKTVETYRSRIMEKLRVPNMASLIKFALQHGVTAAE